MSMYYAVTGGPLLENRKKDFSVMETVKLLCIISNRGEANFTLPIGGSL